MFSFVPTNYRSIPAEARADRGVAAAEVVEGVGYLGASVGGSLLAPIDAGYAVAAAALSHYGKATDTSLRWKDRQFLTCKDLSAIDLVAFEIIHDIQRAYGNKKVLLNKKEILIGKINQLLGLIKEDAARQKEIRSEASWFEAEVAVWTQENGSDRMALVFDKISFYCRQIVDTGLSKGLQRKISSIGHYLNNLRCLGCGSEEDNRQSALNLLSQLKLEYSGELIDLGLGDCDSPTLGEKAARSNDFEIFKFLVKNLSDFYVDFIIHDILQWRLSDSQQLQLLDLAFQNEKVREAFYRDGVQIIYEVAKQQLLTDGVLEQFFLTGFDIRGKANGHMTLLEVIHGSFSVRWMEIEQFDLMADFLDLNVLLGNETVTRITQALSEGRGEELKEKEHVENISMVQRMKNHQIYQRALDTVRQQEKQKETENLLIKRVDEEIGVNAERPRGIPSDLVRLIAGVDGYDPSGTSRQAVARQVLELRRSVHGLVAPRDAGAAAAGSTKRER